MTSDRSIEATLAEPFLDSVHRCNSGLLQALLWIHEHEVLKHAVTAFVHIDPGAGSVRPYDGIIRPEVARVFC